MCYKRSHSLHLQAPTTVLFINTNQVEKSPQPCHASKHGTVVLHEINESTKN